MNEGWLENLRIRAESLETIALAADDDVQIARRRLTELEAVWRTKQIAAGVARQLYEREIQGEPR